MRAQVKRWMHKARPTSLAVQVALLARSDSYLRQTGWVRSAAVLRPVDREGRPIPWYSYGMISLLEERIDTVGRVFEWGSGNSTHWWSNRADEVVGVEHDPDWFNEVRQDLPGNVTLELVTGDDAYVRAPERHGLFDVIVIDGNRRNQCCSVAKGCLTAQGVIILDNSDRRSYEPAIQDLHDGGFRSINFSGLSPANHYLTQTSVFYSDGNLLQL